MNKYFSYNKMIIYDFREERSGLPKLGAGENKQKWHGRQLPRGDYLIVEDKVEDNINGDINNNNVLAVIERKSLNDFCASIKDGRRINKNDFAHMSCPVYYIIERTRYTGSIDSDIIMASALRLSYEYGYFPIFTKSISDSAKMINLLATQLSRADRGLASSEKFAPCKLAVCVEKKTVDPCEKFISACPRIGAATITKSGGADKLLYSNNKHIRAWLSNPDAVYAIPRLQRKIADRFIAEHENIAKYLQAKIPDKKYKLINTTLKFYDK